jgi:hypothetical protein
LIHTLNLPRATQCKKGGDSHDRIRRETSRADWAGGFGESGAACCGGASYGEHCRQQSRSEDNVGTRAVVLRPADMAQGI